jgi:hypothetical protein
MASLAALGATYTDLVFNAIFRGSVGTPPTTLYFSLGASGSTTVPTEITTTRTAVKVRRGWLSGQNSYSYPYQSTGSVSGPSNVMHEGFDIYCSGMGANTYTTPNILIYDAASAGNLLMAIEPAWTRVAQVINGDIVRIGSPYYDSTYLGDGGFGMGVYNLALPAQIQYYAKLFDGGSSSPFTAYANAMITDWLFRGFDSVNDLFDPTTYPNVYLAMHNSSTGAEFTDIPRVGVPRTTGVWSAPAYVAPGTNLERKITSLVDIAFPAATGANTRTQTALHIHMGYAPQAFDDTLYIISPFGTLNYAIGDIISFPTGLLELVLN